MGRTDTHQALSQRNQNTFIACLPLASHVFFELCSPFSLSHAGMIFRDSQLQVSRPWSAHADLDNVLRFPRGWLPLSLLSNGPAALLFMDNSAPQQKALFVIMPHRHAGKFSLHILLRYSVTAADERSSSAADGW